MSTTTKLGDDFLRIPKLEVTGTNWVIYKDRFKWAVDARGLSEHLEVNSAPPPDPLAAIRTTAGVAVAVALTAQQLVLENEWKKEMKDWKQGEAIVKQQIAGTIPDSLFMKIRSKTTASEIWTELGNEFQKKSRMVSVDLRRRLQEERCDERGDIRTHFTRLRTMREDLAAMGQQPTEDDFYAIILGSLPSSFDPYISAVSATSSVLGTTLSADELMLTVTDEYERRLLRKNGTKDDKDVAFYSKDSSRWKGRGGSKSQSDVECFNCKKKGHFKSDCWAEGRGKAGQGPKGKGRGKAKANVATVNEEDEA
jgi:hypothetical protein